MQYGLNEEQEMIVSTVRSFVEKEIYPHEELVEKTGSVPKEIAQDIKQKTIDLGFYACNFPEEVGGAGLNHKEFTLVERELGRGSMALCHFFGRPQNILMACNSEQKERYLLPAVKPLLSALPFKLPYNITRHKPHATKLYMHNMLHAHTDNMCMCMCTCTRVSSLRTL